MIGTDSTAAAEVSTRVMIFSSFRESVQEIAEMLNRHQPLVKVMTFMGQASAGKGVRGFTQKEQLEVSVLIIILEHFGLVLQRVLNGEHE